MSKLNISFGVISRHAQHWSPWTRPYVFRFSPLMDTLKPQFNGQYSNAMIGTLAVDGWDVTFGKAKSQRRNQKIYFREA